ncbi:MAG TPA: AAA family ATPase [Fimbriiglobus sp.]|jgi:AAA+ superfamily predicted ATPase|nr:AAA family ATPase [Fimbriiglobus sp.]
MPTDDPFAPLREALAVSPTNVPLRLHLADGLLSAGRADEAEATCKDGLTRTPNEPRLKLALARAYLRQGKHSAGIVVCEDLTRADASAEAYLLLARLLHLVGEPDRAASAYRQAIDADPSAADPDLEKDLGLDDEPYEPGEDDTDFGGRVPANFVPVSDERELERPKITFADVGGMEPVKEDIRLKIIHPLTHADLYKAYGKSIGGGLLMYGPPGCGKTHLARATAGEVKAAFLSVGLHDVLNMWLGNSEKNLHAVFQQARRNKPCVLFFDEVDALAASRADFRHTNARTVINQFLSELDGVDGSNDGVLVLAATNAPWHMDSAFRRPGRFDRIVFVPPPDATARASIVKLHIAGKPQEKIDFNAVAKATAEHSGADLKAVVDRAVEIKLREAMRTGVPKPLTTQDLLTAAKGVKPSTREWLSDARNYAMYANDGGQYDDLAAYLKLR